MEHDEQWYSEESSALQCNQQQTICSIVVTTEQKYFDIEEKELFSQYWLQGTMITDMQTDNLNSMIWECLSASHNRILEKERQINV
jgi:hypothetical protein